MSLLSRSYFRRTRFFSLLLSISLAITLLSPAALAWQQQSTTATPATSAAVATRTAPTLTTSEC
jgi:hypothetical protein